MGDSWLSTSSTPPQSTDYIHYHLRDSHSAKAGLDKRFYNPALITSATYATFFPKYLTLKYKSDYLNSKMWAPLLNLQGVHTLRSAVTTTTPLSMATALDLYPTVTSSKRYITDEITFSKGNLLGVLPAHNTHLRASNPFHLRSSAKESLTTYNALRKVFKARFDENRSNLRFGNISGLGIPAPFINMPKVGFENLLTKNSSYFLTKASYKTSFSKSFSTYWSLDSLLNFYLSDLPFLKSLKSDASRYIWFDWGSRWEKVEVQPSSIARYSLLGVPYSTNKFSYSLGDNPKKS